MVSLIHPSSPRCDPTLPRVLITRRRCRGTWYRIDGAQYRIKWEGRHRRSMWSLALVRRRAFASHFHA